MTIAIDTITSRVVCFIGDWRKVCNSKYIVWRQRFLHIPIFVTRPYTIPLRARLAVRSCIETKASHNALSIRDVQLNMSATLAGKYNNAVLRDCILAFPYTPSAHTRTVGKRFSPCPAIFRHCYRGTVQYQ